MLSISQSMPGRVIERERDTAEVYHKLRNNGGIYVFKSLDDNEHSSKTILSVYCDSMSALSTDDIFFVFSWQFAMLCTVPITKP